MDSQTAKFVTAHPIGPLQTVIIELAFYRTNSLLAGANFANLITIT